MAATFACLKLTNFGMGRTFADTACIVVGPVYREEPVKGSPCDGDKGAGGVGAWAATYLDAPVKESASYCQQLNPLSCDILKHQCKDPHMLPTCRILFDELTTSSMYVNGRSLLCKNR